MISTNLILVRHGESQWNKENRFTGWQDIDLSEQGWQESKKAGLLLKKQKCIFDYAYTSVLKRAIHTLCCILDQLDQSWIPVKKSWKLNERHYGALQGLNKSDVVIKHGKEKTKQWRRGFSIIPPKLTKDDKRYPGHDIRYSKLSEKEIPVSESLSMTFDRVFPFWKNEIFPKVKRGKNIIIVAHGNSLRALLKALGEISEKDIVELNIPTASPISYKFDNSGKPISYTYLK